MVTRVLPPNIPVAPQLPVGPEQYTKHDFDKYSNVLRLYFNQLDNYNRYLTGNSGGSTLRFPYGAFHQDGTTTLSVSISNVSTTPISVASTAGFPSAGWILIGSEIIQYTTKTATTFDGTITRGVLGTTNVAHTAGAAISEVQGTGSPTTIGTVLFNNTDASNGVYASADFSKVYFDYDGLYNIQLSAQLLNFTSSEDNVTMWFRKNGVDIPASASIEQVNSKHGSAPGARILAFNLFVDVVNGDYIQLAWASDSGNTAVATYPAGTSPVHPVSPALILTAQFVSAPLS
jgi:hypothetical protein